MTSVAMQKVKAQSGPDWRAIALFYFLACLWSWPFFWWRDVHTASWNAWRLPEEIKGLTQPWGPGLAAIAIFYLFPQARSRFASLAGGSWKRSAVCFLAPICFASIANTVQSRHFGYKLVVLPGGGRLLDVGRGTGLARIPAGRASTPRKSSGLPAPCAPVGAVALHFAHEGHVARGGLANGDHRPRGRGDHGCARDF